MNDVKKRALKLLKIWCDKLAEYEIHHKDKLIDGALLCPCCHVIHGRSGDLIYPLVTLYKETGDEKYLTLAKRSIDFTEASLVREGGGYLNDRGNRWFGISAFSALAIGETLLEFGDIIPKVLYNEWESIFLRLNEFCYNEFDNFSPVINYRAGAAAVFAMGYVFTKDEKYLAKANEWESYCRRHIDEDGILFGECHPHDDVSEKGCHGIDLGYNLEESIPLLIMHSYLLKDNGKLDFYKQIFTKHLEFLLPDGAIDNSFGIRHNKWTYFGSRTSDGALSGLAKLPSEPIFNKATERILSLYEKLTFDGLLSLPMAKAAGEPTCLHHTFCHAKAVSALYNSNNESFSFDSSTLLPREHEYGVKLFHGGNLATVSKEGFTATVSALDFVRYDGADNFGGSLNLLWHKNYGPICAATMHEYVPSEPLNMQYLMRSLKTECMTPRVVIGEYSSDTDKSVSLSVDGGTVYAVSDNFSAEYSVRNGGFEITVSADGGEYILPIITKCGDEQGLSTGAFSTGALTVTSSKEPANDGKSYFNQVGGFIYTVLRFPLSGPSVKIRIEVKS